MISISSLCNHTSNGFSIISLKSFNNLAATAPSRTLWSADKVEFNILTGTILSSITLGTF